MAHDLHASSGKTKGVSMPFRSNWFGGAVAGVAVGVLAWIGLSWFITFRLGLFAFAAVGGLCGTWVGRHGGPIAHWCVWTAAVLGSIGFVLGFVGPILVQPHSPQGPLLGILITGPLGIVLGSLLGLIIGFAREHAESDRR